MCSLQTGIHFRTTRKEAKVVPSMTLASWCSLPADSRQGRRCSCCLALQRSCKRRERPGKPHSSELCWLHLLPRPLFLPLSPCSTCRTRLTNAPFVPFSHGAQCLPSRPDPVAAGTRWGFVSASCSDLSWPAPPPADSICLRCLGGPLHCGCPEDFDYDTRPLLGTGPVERRGRTAHRDPLRHLLQMLPLRQLRKTVLNVEASLSRMRALTCTTSALGAGCAAAD